MPRNINKGVLVAWAKYGSDHEAMSLINDRLSAFVSGLPNSLVDSISVASTELTESTNVSIRDILKWAESLSDLGDPAKIDSKSLSATNSDHVLLAVSVCKLLTSRLVPPVTPPPAIATTPDASQVVAQEQTEEIQPAG